MLFTGYSTLLSFLNSLTYFTIDRIVKHILGKVHILFFTKNLIKIQIQKDS